ncbi:hypothetical protein BHE74_00036376 [Ensete ventricosum]|nr:hypothetical protein BHE74_00036376 [Ensete ventricosum]
MKSAPWPTNAGILILRMVSVPYFPNSYSVSGIPRAGGFGVLDLVWESVRSSLIHGIDRSLLEFLISSLPVRSLWIPRSPPLLMYLLLPGADSDAKEPYQFLGIRPPPPRTFLGKDFFFCLPRDRWDKEFAKLQAG